MKLKQAAGLGALMLALTACTSIWPWTPEPQPASTVSPLSLAPPAVNRFAEVAIGEPDRGAVVFDDASLDRLRSRELKRFSGEAEFLSWLKLTREAAQARGMYSWRSVPMPVAAMESGAIPPPPPPPSQAPPPPPPPPGMVGEAADMASDILVTGSAPDGANPEITNNQKAGVDEGGIVKQIGNHLVVLQDGRLFITDLMPDGKAGLKLTDRANVYRSDREDTWYDEMLVSGRTILVTGYSYRENATEFTVLTLGETGKATRQATFYISSDDYYSGSNYASRMIDGKLVIHTPIYLSGQGWWDAFSPPEIREWRREGPEGERGGEPADGRPLFKAEDIWMPVQRVLEPVVHTVTVCDISGVTDASAPACTATAIVGSEDHEFLVTKDSFWLWLSPGAQERTPDSAAYERAGCNSREGRAPIAEIAPSVLVKLPVSGDKPSVLGVRGEPQNQFSMDMDAGTFRAVVDWNSNTCGETPGGADLTFFDTPLGALSSVLKDQTGGRYVQLPSPGTSNYEARFTESHLVYGARGSWGTWAPQEGEAPRGDGRAIIVPVDHPDAPVTVTVPHDVIRAERAGPYMALTGYRDHRGLSVSLIDLRKAPRLASTYTFDNRFESENRSHAFNSRIGADGKGLIGLPTVPRSEESDRWWWWSASSDLTYLETDANGKLTRAGDLIATRTDPEKPLPSGYSCEVSCVDWYGNARPVFTGGRILALVNSELIEGVHENGKVREVRRIDLTQAPEE